MWINAYSQNYYYFWTWWKWSYFCIRRCTSCYWKNEFATYIREAQHELANILEDLKCTVEDDTDDNPDFDPPDDFDRDNPAHMNIPDAGSRIELLWLIYNVLYPGMIYSTSNDGNLHVHYNNGDKEPLNITCDTWLYETPPLNTHPVLFKELASDDQGIFQSMFQTFSDNLFLLFHAQGFPAHVVVKSLQIWRGSLQTSFAHDFSQWCTLKRKYNSIPRTVQA